MPVRIAYPQLGKSREAALGQTLLQAIKLHNVPVQYSCENAECGTCVMRILKGVELLSPMEAIEDATLRAKGYEGFSEPEWRLACQAVICGEGEIAVKQKVSL